MSTIAHGQYPQRRPNGLWRGSSAMVMGLTGSLSKGFLNGLNEVQTTGLDNFVKLLDSREDPFQRQRGLITGMPYPFTRPSSQCLIYVYHSCLVIIHHRRRRHHHTHLNS